MLQSRLFGKTVKDTPSDLKAASHRLLYRGGFIRQISAGRYAFLPLGYKVWQKIMNVIDEEMEKVGSQRVITPVLQPIEVWKVTNRDQAFGDEMHVLKDHHGSTFALGATAEGVMTELVKMFNLSYKNLPVYIHQFATKFRDEKRPKEGLIRVREFVMKDAYSFDKSQKESRKSYRKFFDSYLKIAKRFGLEVIPVIAESGAIGGEYNHEFIVKTKGAGEGGAFICSNCDYAAHFEKATSGFKKYAQDKKMKKTGKHIDDTVVTCSLLAEKMGIPLHVTTKTILFRSGGNFVAAMVRGDYDINEKKLRRFLDTDDLNLANEEEIKNLTGSEVGFMGPIGLPENVRVVADLTCKDRANFEVGGNETGVHLYNVNFKRDFPTPSFADIRAVKEMDPCMACGEGKLKMFKGIEWGHCFCLDTFYSEPHSAVFIDKKGKQKPLWMGSYGIGLGRTMATIVEIHHDEKGIVWPVEVAPFDVHLVELEGAENAKPVYEKLEQKGFDVLWDDRETGAGEKLTDADLIGIPVRLVVSGRLKGKIEWKGRSSEKTEILSTDEVIKKLNIRGNLS